MYDQTDVQEIKEGLETLANAITPIGAETSPSRDKNGGCVASLTEAVISISESLHAIADALSEVAEAIRDQDQGDR